MNKEEFEGIIQKVKNKNPVLFGLDSDRKPMPEEISLIEKDYHIVLPKSYKEFLLQYGGGYFAYTVVYSLDPTSPFYVKDNVSNEFVSQNKFFPVIDLETGDLAGFEIDHGRCSDIILFYSHEEKTICSTGMNFYDALAEYALGKGL